jgi:hypothetical protein
MNTVPETLDTLRTQLTDTIEHGTELLVGLKALDDSFPKILPLLAVLSERERATEIAVLCGFHPLLRTYLHQLIESLADVLAGLTAADGGEAWLRRQIDTMQTPGEANAA